MDENERLMCDKAYSKIQNFTNNTPRFEQVAFLSKNLRELARELEIPIIVLSQVTRNAEGWRV